MKERRGFLQKWKNRGRIRALRFLRQGQEITVNGIIGANQQLQDAGEHTPLPPLRTPSRRDLAVVRHSAVQQGANDLVESIDTTVRKLGYAPLSIPPEELRTYQRQVLMLDAKQTAGNTRHHPTEIPSDFFKNEKELKKFRQFEADLHRVVQTYVQDELHIPCEVQKMFIIGRHREVGINLLFGKPHQALENDQRTVVSLEYIPSNQLLDRDNLRTAYGHGIRIAIPLSKRDSFPLYAEDAMRYLTQIDDTTVSVKRNLEVQNITQQSIQDLLTLIIVGKGISIPQ